MPVRRRRDRGVVAGRQGVTPVGSSNYPALGGVFSTPTWCLATISTVQNSNAGAPNGTNQRVAGRRRIGLAAGRWLALAPVFIAASITTGISPVGTNTHPRALIDWSLERRNGVNDANANSPNTGGTVVTGGFDDLASGAIAGGQYVVGKPIYASAFGLSAFQRTNLTDDWWGHMCLEKTNAADVLPGGPARVNAPYNEMGSIGTTFAALQTLIATSGITGYNTGNDKYGDTGIGGWLSGTPGAAFWIGIPMDGQEESTILSLGTSIYAGFGLNEFNEGGASQFPSPTWGDLPGMVSMMSQRLDTGNPSLMWSVSSSAASHTWGPLANVGDAGRTLAARALICFAARFVKYAMWHDPENDVGLGYSAANYGLGLDQFCEMVKAANPLIKVIAVRPPRGGLGIAENVIGFSTIDAHWAEVTNRVGAKVDKVFDLREGDGTWQRKADRFSGAVTSVGSTTQFTVTALTWANSGFRPNDLRSSWIEMLSGGSLGQRRQITMNLANGQVTYSSAMTVLAGETFKIMGNTSHDMLHPNVYGALDNAARFRDMFKVAYPKAIYFTRTLI